MSILILLISCACSISNLFCREFIFKWPIINWLELMTLILLIKGVHLCILQARWVIIIFYFWKMFRTLCMWLPKVIIINSIKKLFRSYLTFPWLFKQRLGPFECSDVILLLPTMSILRESRFLLRFDIFNLAILVLVFDKLWMNIVLTDFYNLDETECL